MKENYLEIVKYASLAVIVVCLLINIISYVSLFNLKSTNEKLTTKLQQVKDDYYEKSDYYDYLINNKEELNDIYLREEKNLVKNGETVINF